MNQPLEIIQHDEELDPIHEIGERIILRVTESSREFETFYSLLSSTVWQSPAELAEAWIWLVAREDYENLLAKNEDREITERKDRSRTRVLATVSTIIQYYSENPTLLQQIKSQFLVHQTLVHALPLHDQDRIIAKEIGISYATWQKMLGFFAHHSEFLNFLLLPDANLDKNINESGEDEYVLFIPEWDPEKIKKIELIPGIRVEYTNFEDIITDSQGKTTTITTPEFPAIVISEKVLLRYEQIIWMEKEKANIRKAVHLRVGEIPVWKKRFDVGGDNKREREEQRKLAIEGV